jgi:Ca2+-binding EF-hand superfamily protein
MLKENDKNGDGTLAADELPERMQQMLEDADKDSDGQFTREELLASVEGMRERFRGRRGRGFRGGQRVGANDRGPDPRTGQFMRNDINNDGRLTLEEIPRQMRQAFRAEDDRNGDGAIDAGELQMVIARMGGAAEAVGAGVDPNEFGDPNTFRDPNRRNR